MSSGAAAKEGKAGIRANRRLWNSESNDRKNATAELPLGVDIMKSVR
jgi:hypothetical protein